MADYSVARRRLNLPDGRTPVAGVFLSALAVNC